MKEVSCPQCEFVFLVQDRPKYTTKKLPKFPTPKNSKGWLCPACNTTHHNVYTNICPTCNIDFNSKEFDDVCRQKGLI